jgi:hypothetical protein
VSLGEIKMNVFEKTLFECTIHNHPDCELFTTDPDRFSEWDDKNGTVQRCCIVCDPPLTEKETKEMRREYVESYEAALADGRLDDAEYYKEQIAEIDADTRRA